MDILRFITAGNVDDGESTLIGRLLHDSDNVKTDNMESLAAGGMNLAHLTDGLKEERVNQITVDVAYKYFTNRHRKFVVTDAPGHFQYLPNLITGASSVDCMIVLIDAAKKGVTPQTRRHTMVASFLSIRQIVVAINKMDLVNYQETVFYNIRKEFSVLAGKLEIQDIVFIPVSALLGDNVFSVSNNMNWYKGKSLMQFLESYQPVIVDTPGTRFSVQYVHESEDAVRCFGNLVSGTMEVGDMVKISPGKGRAIIKRIQKGYEEVLNAKAGDFLSIEMENEVFVKRGSIISLGHAHSLCVNRFEATICWLNASRVMQPGDKFILRIHAATTSCIIHTVIYKTDTTIFQYDRMDKTVRVSEFARVIIETKEEITFDRFLNLPGTGRGILIDMDTNYTSAALLVRKPIR